MAKAGAIAAVKSPNKSTPTLKKLRIHYLKRQG